MKRQDLLFTAIILAILLPLVLSPTVFAQYSALNSSHPYLLAYLKFALLATMGESLGLRIKNGTYNEAGFGLLPRAIVWGLFGIWIAAAMKSFAIGAPHVLESLGVEGVVEAMKNPMSVKRVLGAFSISVMMNGCFAPVFMTLHKVSDTHILNCGGRLKALVTPMHIGKILGTLNWDIQWGFVFKKSVPLFWLPAHTITFLLPTEYQVLFAALLSVALGIILSVAAVMSRKKQKH